MASASVISAVNYWEVLVRAQIIRGQTGLSAAEGVISGAGIEIAVVDAEAARAAAEAFQRFKGRPGGRLNLGDCFAYALARRLDAPLLYKGNDFALTDVRTAI